MPPKLERWLGTLDRLLADVEKWCAARKWLVDRQQTSLTESKLGSYKAPLLMVRGPAGIVYVEPVARYVTAGDGLVDVYSWPSLRRMTLVRKNDRWELRTDSGVPWPHDWSEATFGEIVQALSVAA